MSTPFGPREIDLLKGHLKAIVAVEAMTVPLYLASVYSFTDRALGFTPDQGQSYPLYDVQQMLLSVAVQEMYHLQLACNLCNAFQVAPEIPRMTLEAGADLVVPHLEEEGRPIVTRLGNVPAMLHAFIDVERPDGEPYAPPGEAIVYPSIAELYHATLELLGGYMQAFASTATALDPHFSPDERQIAYAAFASTYRYNTVGSRPLVAKVASAITDQGEGNVVAGTLGGHFSSASGDEVLPEFQPRPGTRFAAYGRETHFKRFEEAQRILLSEDWPAIVGGPVFHEPNGVPSGDLPSWAASFPVLQASVNTIWSYLLDVMERGFARGDLSAEGNKPGAPSFGDVMLSFKYTLPQCWQHGQAPSFVYRPGVEPGEVQKAMDAVDPLCLFHWDARTAAIRARGQFNACQGLNECAGLGWGGVATGKGNGACATTDLHTCGANNQCRFQGGCGFLMSRTGEACGGGPVGELLPPSEQWIPGANVCASHGGCQTPISTGQRFNRYAGRQIAGQTGPDWPAEAKEQLASLRGTGVWDRARRLFALRMRLRDLPEPLAKEADGLHYDGLARRNAIAPTSR